MEDSDVENQAQGASLPTKSMESKAEKALIPGMEKIHQLMPTMPSNTLLENSARALANAWMQDQDLVPDFTDHTLQSEMGLVFKVQVAIHLQGLHLLKWIRSQHGLESLAHRIWPDLFQRLLTTIFVEMGRDNQRLSVVHSLRYILQDYKAHVSKSQHLEHTLQRLGLTNFFRQGKTSFDDNLIMFYYWFLEDRTLNFRGKLPLVYPLPIVLQSRWPKLQDYDKLFTTTAKLLKKKSENGVV